MHTLYPFHQKPLSAPAWQTFHNLTQAAAQGNTQQLIQQPDAPEAPEYASSESDADESIGSATQSLHNDSETKDQADKQMASDEVVIR